MKKLVILFQIILVITACENKSKIEKAVEEVPVDVKVHRFEKDFFESKPEDLAELKQEYPFFFPPGYEQEAVAKLQDPIWKEVFTEVEKKYDNFTPEQEKIENLFKHIKYYFPNTKVPVIYTIIGEMDYNTKVLYAKDTLIISLELYLGKNHKFYTGSFDSYMRDNFEQNQILPDIVSAWALPRVPPPDNTFLAQMIYAGKQLYLKDIFLPDYSDADKIGYQPAQAAWCAENEGYIWSYFVGSQLLYSTDQKLVERFLAPAPFSKFYLEIDNDSPGRTGAYIGWQIVRAYMETTGVSIQDLLRTDAKQIFEKSRYKPKKTND
ncbi:MAG: gliding motility lipoprotein GldB [Flavobacterium sp.]|uniref:gliding motility lipoprotein GldB n=1 Tax=Flavobacterium sp. TaxID=239 RepID=UPI0011F8E236|nr:gliding motility lipoprotein GldB [Flavobacterium sp.]RZJ67198.1 MAG: gliding motility lipoprotein GldB [Flavobacterium sp.]